MDKYKKRKIVIIFIAIIVLIFILLLFVNKIKNSKKNFPEEIPDDLSNTEIENFDSTVKNVDIRNNYYIVKNCITNFYSMLDNSMISENGKKNTAKYLINLLDKDYLTYSGINEENILERLKTYDGASYVIDEILVSQRSFEISVYFVYGRIRCNGNISNFFTLVKVDRQNNTFSIYLQDYLQNKYFDIKVGDTIEFDTLRTIENNGNNIFEYKNINNETYAEDLFNNIKFYVLYDNESLYNMLNDNYKSEFTNYNSFYNSISVNYLKFIRMKYGNYNKINNGDGTTEYVLIDSDDKIKFDVYEIAPFKYKISIEYK